MSWFCLKVIVHLQQKPSFYLSLGRVMFTSYSKKLIEYCWFQCYGSQNIYIGHNRSRTRLLCSNFKTIENQKKPFFSLPMSKVLSTEPIEHAVYDSAHRLGVLLQNCDIYECPISLVDLAQGYYNAPAPKVDTGLNPWSLFSSSFI